MNRSDLQKIAVIRLREGKALLDAGLYNGAYYLSGYAIECALKACIARQTKRFDFPDKGFASDSYTHDIEKLVRVAGLSALLDHQMKTDSVFATNWGTVKDWKEISRYQSHSQKMAENLYAAIADRRNGVLRWIKQYW